MTKKLKIAIYSGQIPSTTFIESLIRTVGKHHNVFLFGTQNKAINYANKNIKIYKTPLNNWLKLGLNIWRSLLLGIQRPRDLINLLTEVNRYTTTYKKWQNYSKILPIVLYRPSVIHLQWAKSLEDLIILKTVFNIPIVLSLRGAHINYSPIVSKHLADSYSKNFLNVDAFHAVSRAISVEAEKYGSFSDRTHVIYSIIPKLFIDAYKPLKQKKGRLINILSVGRPHWIKGYNYIIKALVILKNLGYNIQYRVVGIDTLNEELTFLISELGLKQNVILQKSVPQKELITLMQSQDVMILSSLAEGIANVVLEAMAVGLPVISTNCGGMSEVIIPGKTGFLIPIRDEKAISQAIIDLNHMPHDQLQIQTENAHNLIKLKFNQEKNINKFLNLYKSVAI